VLNKKLIKSLLLLLSVIIFSGDIIAQEADSDELNSIQMELNKSAVKKRASGPTVNSQDKDSTVIKDFKGLGELAPFAEISVIQKRFMPKTERVQLFAGLTTVTNDPFFNTFGATLKASYFLNETWGLEANYFGLTTSETKSTSELKSNNNVKAESLAYPKSYYGVDLMFVPIYGKISWFNKRIVPFDLYFSTGYGSTQVSNGQDSGTVHLAVGQIFAMNKGTAFRWDFSWNFFNTSVSDRANVTSSSSFNNLFLTVGMSWSFPEAKYR
jgi:outer membrane beta-barrel protein